MLQHIGVCSDGHMPLQACSKSSICPALMMHSLAAMSAVPCSTKFLVDRSGNPVRRFKSGFDPRGFEDDVSLYTAHIPHVNLLCTGVWQQCLHSRLLLACRSCAAHVLFTARGCWLHVPQPECTICHGSQHRSAWLATAGVPESVGQAPAGRQAAPSSRVCTWRRREEVQGGEIPVTGSDNQPPTAATS